MKNQVQLCTYADRFGKKDFSTLTSLVNNQFNLCFSGIHILPFYSPIDGADAGFDPIDHTIVDDRLGSWQSVTTLADSHEIMADVIVNHMSCSSPEFQDLLKNGDASPFADLFLTYEKVFPEGATEQQLTHLYRPRPGLPFTKIKLQDGSEKLFWTTFTSGQIDIDVFSATGQAYLTRILDRLKESKVTMIRLDAAGYAVKKAGSRCFMTKDTFDFIAKFTQQAAERGIDVLVEIHAHYLTQVAIAKKANWVYDFALPPLVLHALTANDSQPLQAWYEISPRNAITVLDTHDGIGIIDIAAEKGVGPGLLSDQQVDTLVEAIHKNSNGASRKATGSAASNVDLYQVNCTFYDALAKEDNAYLLARLIQFFSPGIPQVYYVGLLAGENDMTLLEQTGVGRDINRHYYSVDEIESELQRPVVKYLLSLIKFRNMHPAFQEGKFSIVKTEKEFLHIDWKGAACGLELSINLVNRRFILKATHGSNQFHLSNWEDFSTWVEENT